MKRVQCLYRVSTKGQVDHDDIPMQKIACREFAKQQGWVIVKEIQEKGVSGYKVKSDDRDAINEMKRDALAGKYDILLVFMFDRIGRRDDETPFVVQWFVAQGIEVWSTREGEQRFDSHVDKLINYIRFWQSSGESEKTAIRIRTKHVQMIQDGIYRGGHIPYGYKLEYQGRVNKKNIPVRDLVIDEEQAAVVRTIFHLIVDEGYGMHRVANYLNNLGIKTRKNTCLWRDTSLRAIIQNSIYTGRMHLGDEISEPFEKYRIIDDSYVSEAMRIIKGRGPKATSKEHIGPRNTNVGGMLTGTIYCGECGSRLTFSHCHKKIQRAEGIVHYDWYVYRCFRKLNAPKACSGQSTYTVSKVEEAVLPLIRQFFANILKVPAEDMLRSAVMREHTELVAALGQADKEVKKAQSEMTALEEAVMKSLTGESVLDDEFIKQMIPKRRAALDAATQRYNEIKGKMEDSANIAATKAAEIEKTKAWAAAFDVSSFTTKRMILARLIDKVTVKRGYEIEVSFRLTPEEFLGVDVLPNGQGNNSSPSVTRLMI